MTDYKANYILRNNKKCLWPNRQITVFASNCEQLQKGMLQKCQVIEDVKHFNSSVYVLERMLFKKN